MDIMGNPVERLVWAIINKPIIGAAALGMAMPPLILVCSIGLGDKAIPFALEMMRALPWNIRTSTFLWAARKCGLSFPGKDPIIGFLVPFLIQASVANIYMEKRP